jgi:hypothetical protein
MCSIRSTVARKENSPDDKSGPRLNGGSSHGLYGTARFQEYFVTWVIWFREEEKPRWQLAHGLVEHQSDATRWQRAVNACPRYRKSGMEPPPR